MGRSNVGKSSMLNALTRKRKLARVSGEQREGSSAEWQVMVDQVGQLWLASQQVNAVEAMTFFTGLQSFLSLVMTQRVAPILPQFEKVEAEPEVRGGMGGNGLDDFTVNGQHVITDDKTLFENRVAGVFSAMTFAQLANTNEVEVHGGRDDLGNIRAIRVERRDDNPLDEVKGTVSGLPARMLLY